MEVNNYRESLLFFLKNNRQEQRKELVIKAVACTDKFLDHSGRGYCNCVTSGLCARTCDLTIKVASIRRLKLCHFALVSHDKVRKYQALEIVSLCARVSRKSSQVLHDEGKSFMRKFEKV